MADELSRRGKKVVMVNVGSTLAATLASKRYTAVDMPGNENSTLRYLRDMRRPADGKVTYLRPR